METKVKEIPILCINLPRATERREYIEREWINKRRCPIHFIDAFDRRDIEEGKFLYVYNNNKNSKKCIRRELTSGEIACATSHILALEYAKKNNFKEIIIIEDDAEPLFSDYNYLNELMSHLPLEFSKARVVMLHKAYPSLHYIVSSKKKNFSQIKRASYGTCSYYLDCSVYDTFINRFLSFERPLDWYWPDFIKKDQLVIPNRPLVNHITDTTYIGNEFRGKVSHRDYID